VTTLFKILIDWDAADRRATAAAEGNRNDHLEEAVWFRDTVRAAIEIANQAE
jgi:hypothetical protein